MIHVTWLTAQVRQRQARHELANAHDDNGSSKGTNLATHLQRKAGTLAESSPRFIVAGANHASCQFARGQEAQDDTVELCNAMPGLLVPVAE
jgi:hypothetical protein